MRISKIVHLGLAALLSAGPALVVGCQREGEYGQPEGERPPATAPGETEREPARPAEPGAVPEEGGAPEEEGTLPEGK